VSYRKAIFICRQKIAGEKSANFSTYKSSTFTAQLVLLVIFCAADDGVFNSFFSFLSVFQYLVGQITQSRQLLVQTKIQQRSCLPNPSPFCKQSPQPILSQLFLFIFIIE